VTRWGVRPVKGRRLGSMLRMDSLEIQRHVTLEDRHWWHAERRRILDRELRRFPRPGRALDIGAAGGGNCRVLQARGWSAVAADFSEEATRIARERGLEAVQADARDLPFPDGDFDLVVALDVLEHIEEDDLAAAEIRRVLRPGGMAFVAVPCDMALWSAHDVALGHVRRYTRESLRTVLEGSGLRVADLWSWNVLLRPVAALRRRRAGGCDLTETPPLVNAGLRTVVALERYLPLGTLPGVSLMARAFRAP
jgi:SAM-dependent methyltransferase